MKKMYLLSSLMIFIFVLSFNLLNAQTGFTNKATYTSGTQPAYFFTSSDNSAATPFFICAGHDANFNFKFDEGDIRASAYDYKSKYSNPIVKAKDLMLESVSFNLRPGVDELEAKVYIPSSDYIFIYPFPFFNKKLDSVNVPNCRAAEVDENSLYVASGDYTNPGKIYKYIKFNLELKDSIETDLLPFQIMSLPNSTLAYLNEGTFGTPNGKLVFVNSVFEKFEKAKEIILGDTPNHIAKCGDYLYITLNGSHKVIIVDWMSQNVLDSILIPTTGYDGPRQTLVLNPNNSANYKDFYFYTTAYDCHVYYGQGTSIIDKSENNSKKREAIGYFPDNGAIIVTDVSNADYSPANTVTVYLPTVGVNEQNISNLSIYPNPLKNIINIKLNDIDNADCSIKIYDVLGNTVSQANTQIISGGLSYDISNLSLSNGTYYININTSDKLYKSKFVIK